MKNEMLEKKLQELHSELIEVTTECIRDPDVRKPAHLQVALNLLKHNNIMLAAGANTKEFDKLINSLPDFTEIPTYQ
ncbi:hypothetical protein [Aeromonas veronii]|uniref:hypothetical protein n=1 Tax=Aeromonas TaxID=642 RepID=UPI001861BAF8|nr:hypothetical protein [Aeromonas veronii]MCV3285784.1 hypothetical protein [Aeromonas veronii]QNF14438.1 hypothetical protein FT670_10420 [Aeromonas jandaei]